MAESTLIPCSDRARGLVKLLVNEASEEAIARCRGTKESRDACKRRRQVVQRELLAYLAQLEGAKP